MYSSWIRSLGGLCAAALCVSTGFGPAATASTLAPGSSEAALSRPDGRSWQGATSLAVTPDGRLLVAERAGRVWLTGATAAASRPIVDLSDEVAGFGALGLSSVAVDPGFESNGYLYLFFAVEPLQLSECVTPATGAPACRVSFRPGQHATSGATIGRLVRFQLTKPPGTTSYALATSVDLSSRRVLLGETPAAGSLDTGCVVTDAAQGPGGLAFGADGTLFAGCGDGASATGEDAGSLAGTQYQEALAAGLMTSGENVGAFRAQQVDSLSGKILRLDAATGDGVRSNPFYDSSAPRAPRSRVWVLGLHDPQHFTVRPGSGSTRADDGQPGTLYIGDVGYAMWESLDVAIAGRTNFGWPLYEGVSNEATHYATLPGYNPATPNPLYKTACAQRYFRFRDLIHADSPGSRSWPNPCQQATPVPLADDTFLRSRPAIDWVHAGVNARWAAVDSGGEPVALTLGTAAPNGAVVTGPLFGGTISIGGVWTAGSLLPPALRNVYLHADSGGQWIKAFTFDANDNPLAVHDFLDSGGPIRAIAADPLAPRLYYVTGPDGSVVRTISFAPLSGQGADSSGAVRTAPVSAAGTRDLPVIGSRTQPALAAAATRVAAAAAPAATPHRAALKAPAVPAGTPAAAVTLTANPTSLMAGAASTLTWSSSNATSCSAPWYTGSATSGNLSTGAVTTTTSYTMTCTGTGGSGSATAVVSAWTDTDIGAVTPPGSARLSSNVFTINGSGADIFNSADEFNYVYQPLNGNGSIIARVVSQTETDPWAKAGVMIRETLNAGATNAMVEVTPANGGVVQARTSTGGLATSIHGPIVAAPYWVQLVRSGSTFTGYIAPDGVTWTQIGSYTMTMATQAYVGLAVTSHDNGALSTATFDNVTITSAPTVTLAASPTSIASGGTSTLSWSSTNASSCSAPWFTGSATSGVQAVNGITATTTYTVTCAGTGGTGSASATVTVTSTPAPTVTVTASPTSIASGGTSTLSWSSANATSCSAPWFTGSATSGVQAVSAITTTTTYTVTCTGAGGTGSGSATVTVVPAPTVTLTANPTSVASGGSSTLSWNSTNATSCSAPWYTGSATSGTQATPALTAATTYTMTCTGTGGTGSASATVSISAPTSWTDSDIGSVTPAGSDSVNGGTITVSGAGADIWNAADAFNFAYQPLTGNGSITALVVSQTNTNVWAKAGVMIRETLAAGASNATVEVTPGNGAVFQTRTSTGVGSVTTQGPIVTAPYWVRVTRTGNSFTGYVAPDGATWTAIGTYTIPMAAQVYVGLDVTSHDNGTLSTAVFENVGTVSYNTTDTVPPNPPTGLAASIVAPNSVTITWTAATDLPIPGASGIGGYYIYRNGSSTPIATVTSGTSYTDTELSSATTYNYQVAAFDNATPTANVSAPSTALAVTTLPAPAATWSNGDVGSVSPAGSYTVTNGTFAVSGSGADIWNTADAFQFVDQQLTGDGSITARVASQTNTNAWAKAGVMIRETLNAGATNAMVAVTPGNGASLIARTSTGAASVITQGPTTVTAPYWVRVVRAGSTFTGYIAPDGLTWTEIGSYTMTMASPAYVGLAVTSHDNGVLSTAVFDNVTVTPVSAPTVTLAASPTSIAGGGTSTLSWSSSNATSCSAPWYTGSATSGSQAVSGVTTTTTYTMTCTGSNGSGGASATVTVVPAPTVTLLANPTGIATGGSSALSWTSTNATSCSAPWYTGSATSGSQSTGAVSATTTYTMSCTGIGGTGSASATVTVVPPPTVTLSVSPTSIASGSAATLSWSSTNATACTAPWYTGNATAGSQSTGALSASTTYTMSCSGTGGTGSGSATVTVTSTPAPTVTVTASPTSIASGGTSTLSWSSTNATSCSAPWFTGSATSGAQAVSAITATTTYTATCTGAGGTGSGSATVTVVPAPTVTLTANPTSVASGSSSTLTWSSTNATACSATWYSGSATSGTQATAALTTATTYTMSCSGTGGTGSASVTVSIAAPASWTDTDIGSVTPAGSDSVSGGTITVNGAGADIWNTADAFNFVYQPLTGNGSITALVVSQTNTNAWAKAGVMIRETLAAGASNATVELTPGNGAVFQARTSTGASAVTTSGPTVTVPYWVRVTRSGNTFTGYVAPDGATWTPIGQYTIAMANQVYVGLDVTSHDNGALSTAVFQHASTINVAVAPAVSQLTLGETEQFTASVSGAANSAVTWQVNGVAGGTAATGTISSTGLYTAPTSLASAPTTFTVTALSAQDSTTAASAQVTVTNVMVITPRNASLTLSQTQQFIAAVPDGGTINWTVDGIAGGNTTVGTISASGLYTPPTTAGAHTVTATNAANSSSSASAAVAVTDLGGVYTYHNDLARTGQNLHEYALTSATVSGGAFGKRWSCAVDGAVYAQPLYVANLAIGGGVHNVVFVATQHDSVYAFDADNPGCVVYWQTSFLSSGVTTIPVSDNGCADILTEYGITGTPVIDPNTKTLYVVAATKTNGNWYQTLHAINLATGADLTTPTVIQASVTNHSGSTVSFSALMQNQRPGLALNGGNVYIGWASHCDNGPWYGWLMSYSETTLAQTAVFITTPNGSEGGIWMSGGAPAIDSSGSLYLATGNGTFDDTGDVVPPLAPQNDFGESFVKLNPTTLAVQDYYTPSQEASWSDSDLDISSAGVTVLPDGSGPSAHPNVLVGSDKQGHLWMIDRSNMSRFSSTSDNTVEYLTLPGNSTCLNQDQQCVYATPSYWNGYVYLALEHGPIMAMTLTNGLIPSASAIVTPSSQSAEVYGFPTPTVSITGTPSGNGLVWALDNNANGTDNGSATPGPAVLRAYNATNLGSTLYTSSALAADAGGTAVKFTLPVVANGHVYVGGAGQLTVYGLAP